MGHKALPAYPTVALLARGGADWIATDGLPAGIQIISAYLHDRAVVSS